MVSVMGFGRGFELRRTGGVPFAAFGVAAPPPGACCEERRGWLETRRCGFGDEQAGGGSFGNSIECKECCQNATVT
jgi:hypothetical protein